MNYLEIIILSFALAMDAASVSVSNGITIKNISFKHSIIIAGLFGSFQGIMPLIGYFSGYSFSNLINKIDHLIALILLGFIGIKMLLESFKKDEKESVKNFSFKLIILQTIATSIDALAVGVTFVSIDINVYYSCLIIAIITFLISLSAIYIGKKFGNILGNKAEVLGGLILIIIALKIFFKS